MKEKVFILRAIKFNESDLMIHALNRHGARLHFSARGALKSRKRFGGGILEPTRYVLVTYRPGRSRDDEPPVHSLEEASLLRDFEGLRGRYDRLEAGLEMVSLVARMAQPGVEDAHEMFDLLGNGLSAAETSDRLDLLLLQFEVKLLHLQGVLSADEYGDLFTHSLQDHAQIQMSAEQIHRTQRLVRAELERYLKGLGSLSTRHLEI